MLVFITTKENVDARYKCEYPHTGGSRFRYVDFFYSTVAEYETSPSKVDNNGRLEILLKKVKLSESRYVERIFCTCNINNSVISEKNMPTSRSRYNFMHAGCINNHAAVLMLKLVQQKANMVINYAEFARLD